MAASRNRPVLVTGAAGCIGAWVVASLVRRGIAVVALDRSDDRRRLRLLLDEEDVASVPWITGDIADAPVVDAAIAKSDADAIIHLAALQVPFCKADPVAGARVNVVGHVNVFEAARRYGIRRLVYASSVAALPADGAVHISTLYGVYKAAGEGIARVYAQDWGVSSIGLRPHTVYGPGRDQGLTAAPTLAMLAAAAGRPYRIPFSGALLFQYAGEVAEIFTRCCVDRAPEPGRSDVFDIACARVTVEEIVAVLGIFDALPAPDEIPDVSAVAERFGVTSSGAEAIEDLIEMRRVARAERRFEEADAIRTALEGAGVQLEDGPDGTRWVRL